MRLVYEDHDVIYEVDQVKKNDDDQLECFSYTDDSLFIIDDPTGEIFYQLATKGYAIIREG